MWLLIFLTLGVMQESVFRYSEDCESSRPAAVAGSQLLQPPLLSSRVCLKLNPSTLLWHTGILTIRLKCLLQFPVIITVNQNDFSQIVDQGASEKTSSNKQKLLEQTFFRTLENKGLQPLSKHFHHHKKKTLCASAVPCVLSPPFFLLPPSSALLLFLCEIT